MSITDLYHMYDRSNMEAISVSGQSTPTKGVTTGASPAPAPAASHAVSTVLGPYPVGRGRQESPTSRPRAFSELKRTSALFPAEQVVQHGSLERNPTIGFN